MLLVDDILTVPFRGLLWVFQEICDAAQQELDHEADDITGQLQQLYAMLERGEISEKEFDIQEARLLDRLDTIRQPPGRSGEDDE